MPAEHDVQADWPSALAVDLPAAQGSQVWARVAPVAVEYLPWPQSLQGAPEEGL